MVTIEALESSGKKLPETPAYFGADGTLLFGVFHAATGRIRHPVLFCHPFGEEKLWTHRVFVSFARQLAAAGHPVLRFDYTGNGDSRGDFADWTLERGLRDIAVAADELRRLSGAPTVVLMGLRLGATLASQFAERRSDVKALILWEPIVAGAPYAQELLRVNLTTQMSVYREVREDRAQLVARMRAGETVNVDGYEMTAALFDQLSAFDLASTPRTFDGPTLIVQIDRTAVDRPPSRFARLHSLFSRATLTGVSEEPFWKEIKTFYNRAPRLAAQTIEWMDAHGI